MTGVELVKHLEKNGFVCERVRGSHYRMCKDSIKLIVPYHNKELGKGLVNDILKRAGLK
ncbi:MAG: type II toxin-antitoxin system HicA family toxin [Oscillospiraceae bacterium]|nr:type II toxin-antitoxin system HicA family toxin [Oscillospiraceae bacterium]